MIVLVAGLVVIGGSAVGGIALAANRSDEGSSVQPHATPTRSASNEDDHGNNRGNDNESTEDRQGAATPTASTTCDADEVAGDRHGDPNAPDDDAVSGDRHGGDDGGQHHDGLDDDCR